MNPTTDAQTLLKGWKNRKEDATNLRREREGGATRRGEVEKGGVYSAGLQGLVERRRGGYLHLWHRINLIEVAHSHIGLQRGERKRGKSKGQEERREERRENRVTLVEVTAHVIRVSKYHLPPTRRRFTRDIS